MTTTMPIIKETDQFSITQAASVLGIHRHTLRIHTEGGLIKCGYRKHSGRRFYTGKELLRYWRTL